MRKYSSVALALSSTVAALAYCVGDSPAVTGVDSGADASPNVGDGGDAAVAPGTFGLSLQPGHVTADPGDQFMVTINVTRNAFKDPIAFTISPPLGLTTSQPAPALADSTSFTLAANNSIAVGTYDVVITGTSGTQNQQIHLGVLIGSLVVLDGGPYVVPTFTNSVTAKLWGAGGGLGTSCGNGQPGSGGGGGLRARPSTWYRALPMA